MNLNLEGKKALIFDCDGTLADSMAAHKKAYEMAFILNGWRFDEDTFDDCAPFGGDHLMKHLCGSDKDSALIIKDKQMLLPYCLEKWMIPNTELIDLIKQQSGKLKLVVVSNGRFFSILKILDELGIKGYLNFFLTKEHIKQAKPHPEGYLLALEILKMKPEEVIVFEDNEIGITAAKAAGITDIVEVKI